LVCYSTRILIPIDDNKKINKTYLLKKVRKIRCENILGSKCTVKKLLLKNVFFKKINKKKLTKGFGIQEKIFLKKKNLLILWTKF
jgi:hypothetical protein